MKVTKCDLGNLYSRIIDAINQERAVNNGIADNYLFWSRVPAISIFLYTYNEFHLLKSSLVKFV